MDKIWTIIELINWSAAYFAQSKITTTPRLDTELLLAYCLNMQRTQLYMHFDRPLTGQELGQYKQLVRRRLAGEPVAYIRGEKEFWSLSFKVGPQVLIPRPESELLVETALQLWRQSASSGSGPPCILDLGCGSGNLAVSLAKELAEARVAASDLSAPALEIARENARTHQVAERIKWYCGDLFACLEEDMKGQLDLLVSNPPYVSEADFAGLQPEIRNFEPQQALLGGSDGLDVLRRIAADAGSWLKKGGHLCLEIGARQAKALTQLLQDSGQLSQIQIIKDYAGLDRVATACRI